MTRMSAPGARPRVFSGIQPSNDSFQVGNYLGALKRWVDLQETHDCVYSVVDLHAITMEIDPELIRSSTRTSLAQLLAMGVDPDRSVLFVQSQVGQHTELAWVLGCITGFGEAGRMTQFKDKSQRSSGTGPSVGLYTYPILQAADILLYQADGVPVGEDQRQHLELSRDLAQRFNSRFGATFAVPEPLIAKETAKILDLGDPTAKMSKSLPAGAVFLLEPLGTIEKKIKRAVTDSGTTIEYDPEGRPGVSNLLTILAAFGGTPMPDLVRSFEGRGYGDLKKETAAAVVAFAEPFQARVAALLDDPAELDRIASAGAERAEALAEPTVAAVYDRVGFLPRLRRP
jgi:tryptophanyl-tRNA synthetase